MRTQLFSPGFFAGYLSLSCFIYSFVNSVGCSRNCPLLKDFANKPKQLSVTLCIWTQSLTVTWRITATFFLIIYYFTVIFSVTGCKSWSDQLKSKIQKVSLTRPVWFTVCGNWQSPLFLFCKSWVTVICDMVVQDLLTCGGCNKFKGVVKRRFITEQTPWFRSTSLDREVFFLIT